MSHRGARSRRSTQRPMPVPRNAPPIAPARSAPSLRPYRHAARRVAQEPMPIAGSVLRIHGTYTRDVHGERRPCPDRRRRSARETRSVSAAHDWPHSCGARARKCARRAAPRRRHPLRSDRSSQCGCAGFANAEAQVRRGDLALPGRSRISRCFSRFQSRSFSVSRLSYCFLPLARPMSSLTRPLL